MNVSLPSLERLAREGVVFDQATSVAPLTLPAHTSLFTGLLPPNHGVRDNADAPLAEARTTLAEMLLARGFRTGAFVGSMVLDPDRGLKQGFERVPGRRRNRPRDAGESTTSRGRGHGRRHPLVDTVAEAPFFLWTHLYDAHRPYDPPEPYRSVYGHNRTSAKSRLPTRRSASWQALDERHSSIARSSSSPVITESRSAGTANGTTGPSSTRTCSACR